MKNNGKGLQTPKVKQISVKLKILNDDGVFRDRKNCGFGANLYDIMSITKTDIPNDWSKYIVTYKISRRGKLKVVLGKWGKKPICSILNIEDYSNSTFPACILPKDWVGHRATRTMKVIEKGERYFE